MVRPGKNARDDELEVLRLKCGGTVIFILPPKNGSFDYNRLSTGRSIAPCKVPCFAEQPGTPSSSRAGMVSLPSPHKAVYMGSFAHRG